MSNFLRLIDNETIEISRYRNPRIVFNSYQYDDINSYCDLKAIINPFTLYEENEQLKYQLQQKENIIKEVREYITNQRLHKFADTTGGLTYEERKLLEILDKEVE